MAALPNSKAGRGQGAPGAGWEEEPAGKIGVQVRWEHVEATCRLMVCGLSRRKGTHIVVKQPPFFLQRPESVIFASITAEKLFPCFPGGS